MNTEKWKSVFNNHRPLVNEYVLNYILNNTRNDFSLLVKSFFVFYYIVFTNRDMFNNIRNCSFENTPWNKKENNIIWIPNFINNEIDLVEKEKLTKIWLCLMDKWFNILFCNSFFVILYCNTFGYGIYSRDVCEVNNDILNNNEFRHGTFIESINEIEYEVLKFCGFDSFISLNETNKKKSNLYILFGFWMFANSNYRKSKLYFSTGYEFELLDECDSVNRVGNHYRTILNITENWSEIQYSNNIYNESTCSVNCNLSENLVDRNFKKLKLSIEDVNVEDKMHEIEKNEDIQYKKQKITHLYNFNLIETCYREVYLACRLKVKKVKLIKYKQNEQILINYSFINNFN